MTAAAVIHGAGPPPQIECLLELVSTRTGVVRRLDRVVRGVDEPTPPVLYAATVSKYDFKRVPAIERRAAGKGLTASAAIGESVTGGRQPFRGSGQNRRQASALRTGEQSC